MCDLYRNFPDEPFFKSSGSEKSDRLLDMDKKKRIKGKTCCWFEKLASQDELDRILDEDLRWWIQCMKDAGALEE